jgi:hypothetical protein
MAQSKVYLEKMPDLRLDLPLLLNMSLKLLDFLEEESGLLDFLEDLENGLDIVLFLLLLLNGFLGEDDLFDLMGKM